MKWISCLALALLTTTAGAQSGPSSHLADLKVFAGNWRCTGKTMATQFGPEHPTTATIHVSWVLGGYWLHVEYAEQKTKSNPHPASGHVDWGYDEHLKKLAGYAVNNFGGRVAVESDGWNGDTIVWTGQMSAGGAGFATRDSFTRKGKNTIEHKTEAEMGGNWTTLDEETCKKTP